MSIEELGNDMTTDVRVKKLKLPKKKLLKKFFEEQKLPVTAQHYPNDRLYVELLRSVFDRYFYFSGCWSRCFFAKQTIALYKNNISF